MKMAFSLLTVSFSAAQIEKGGSFPVGSNVSLLPVVKALEMCLETLPDPSSPLLFVPKHLSPRQRSPKLGRPSITCVKLRTAVPMGPTAPRAGSARLDL
jgi:hypothetical protein